MNREAAEKAMIYKERQLKQVEQVKKEKKKLMKQKDQLDKDILTVN